MTRERLYDLLGEALYRLVRLPDTMARYKTTTAAVIGTTIVGLGLGGYLLFRSPEIEQPGQRNIPTVVTETKQAIETKQEPQNTASSKVSRPKKDLKTVREDFRKMNLYQWITEDGEPYGLSLSEKDGFFVIDKNSLTKIGNVVGLDKKDLQKYLTTNAHRHLLYTNHNNKGSTLDGIMTTESSGRYDPKKPCNSSGYCGLMQIGKGGAFGEILQVLMNSGQNYRTLRNEREELLSDVTEILDEFCDVPDSQIQGSGLVSLIQGSTDRISAKRKELSEYISQCSNPSQECTDASNLIVYLRKIQEYFNNIIRVHDPKAQALARIKFEELTEGSTYDFGRVLSTVNDVYDIYQTRLTPDKITGELNALWEKSKTNDKLNLAVAWANILFLEQEYDRYRAKSPKAYQKALRKFGIDKSKFVLEAYNKGAPKVNDYIIDGKEIPGDSNYPDKVRKAERLFAKYNDMLYGDDQLKCNYVNGDLKCPLPGTVQEYLKKTAAN